MTDSSGQVMVVSGGTFTNGVMTAVVTVPVPVHHDQFTVTAGSPSSSGTSGNINVEGPLDHLAVTYPGSRRFTDEPFNLSLTAFDSAGNAITTYDQAVTLSDLSGSVSSSETHTTTVPNHWSNGRETISAQVGNVFTHDRITITGPGGGSGTSGVFNVLFGGST